MLLEVLATGQSVLPPTLHPIIKRPYRWLTQATLFNTRLDELPMIGRTHIAALKEALFPWLPRPMLCPPPRNSQRRAVIGNHDEAYARAALADEVQILSGLPCGRNPALFHAVCRLGNFVHHRILPEAEVQAALSAAIHANGYASAPHGGTKERSRRSKAGLQKLRAIRFASLTRKTATGIGR